MVLLSSVDHKPDPAGARDHVPSTQPTSARAQRARSSRLRIRVEPPVRSGDTQHL